MEVEGGAVEGGGGGSVGVSRGFEAAEDPAFVEDAFDEVYGAGDGCVEQGFLDSQRVAGLFLEDIGEARGLARNHNDSVGLILLFLHLGDNRLDLAAEAGSGHKMAG